MLDNQFFFSKFYIFFLCFSDRFYWRTYDPMVFCELFYSMANILVICRLAGLLIVNEAMGPLIISLGRMIEVSFFLYYDSVEIISDDLTSFSNAGFKQNARKAQSSVNFLCTKNS